MAALSLPFITWCIIVAAMTVLISVRLFHKSYNQVNQQSQPDRIIEMVKRRRQRYQ
ncbi:MAG: hypothetical protein K2K45_12280 [Muribaculaceae bacterium]|nr:hypothetical protein [Muribaculaceae bacterium]